MSPLTDALATLWIRDGTLDAVVARKREEAAARQVIARRILAGATAREPSTAYHLWLELGDATDALAFAAAAAARGVRVAPAHAFVVGREPAPHAVRLGLGAAPDRERLTRGLETLAEVLRGEAPRVSVRV